MEVDGLPRVKLAEGALPRPDGDVDNFKDTDDDVPISDASVDKDIDVVVQNGPRFPDRDDKFQLDLGRGATPAQVRTFSDLVTRYVFAERTGDSRVVCSLLLPDVAASLPAEVSRRPGEGCPAAVSVLLARSHQVLTAPVKVVDVRIVGEDVEAVAGSKTMNAGLFLMRRSGGAWRFSELLPHPLL